MPDAVPGLADVLPGRVNEAHARTLAKTAGYRLLMVLITIGVAFAVTRDVATSLNIGIASNAIKTVTYYGHERLWARIAWGTRTG